MPRKKNGSQLLLHGLIIVWALTYWTKLLLIGYVSANFSDAKHYFFTCRLMFADTRELFIWSKLSMAVVLTFTSDSRLLRCVLEACRDVTTHCQIYSKLLHAENWIGRHKVFQRVYPEFIWKLLHWLLHSSKLPVHPLPHLFQRISHLYRDADIIYMMSHTASTSLDVKVICIDLKAWWFVVSVSTHLSDVPHLILKVTDRPLTCHHLLLFVWAHPLHDAIHPGPMMLQRGLWRPIGHFTEVLRETGSPPVRFLHTASTEADICCHRVCICALACTHAHLGLHHMCMNANACIFTLDQVFPALVLLSTGNRSLGTIVLKKKKEYRVYRRCHVSATQYRSGCRFCRLHLCRWAASAKRCTPAEKSSA